jgi:NADH:ubiquinone oxidoreductase subunit 3 (subunit A)
MMKQVKIWIIKGVLIMNALILIGSLIGSSFVSQSSINTEKANQKETSEDQSTGSASFHFISYEAIVPGFHFYIPVVPVLVFEIEISTPYEHLSDHKDPLFNRVLEKVIFSRIICPNAP